MTPLLPAHATTFFGATRQGEWGGVPWAGGERQPLALRGLWKGAACLFHDAVIITTDDDIDTDGSRGSKSIDPWWQPSTNLKRPDGTPIDAWAFDGVVMPPTLAQFGVEIGDLCLVALNGKILPAQLHDMGPARKCGETTLHLGRQIGAVPDSQNDHEAATEGNTVTDMVTLIFKNPPMLQGWQHRHALDAAVMKQLAMERWRKFTGRAAA